MKFALGFLLAFVAVSFVAARPEDGQYTSKYDGINVDEILKSDRLMRNYFNCLMDKGNCTPDGAELKKVLPEALETECAKCSAKQREMSEKVIKHLTEHRPEMWKELSKKYDPDNKYHNKFTNMAKEKGIDI